MHKSCPCYRLGGVIKKNFKFIILLLLVLALGIYNIYSIKSMEREVKNTINKYNAAMEDINTKIEEKDQDLINEFYKLRLDWTNEKIELENKKGEVGRDIDRIYVHAAAFLVITTIFGGIIWTNIERIVKERVHEEIGEKIKIKKEVIENIIDEKDKEKNIKLNKSILLIAKEKKANENVKKFLEKMEFKKIKTSLIDDNTLCENEKIDLVFINNFNGNIADNENNLKEEVEKIVRKYGKERVYFYYNEKRLMLNYYGIKKNFANSEFTLYGNLIETLLTYDKLIFNENVEAEGISN